MLKKFLQGAVFGAGAAVAFLLVYSAWIAWVMPAQLRAMSHMEIGAGSGEETTIRSAPLVEERRYLGSHAMYAGEFPHNKGKVLAAGEGRIVGRVTDEGKPLAGLRVRLALNGSAMSQWAVSDSDGQYEVPVPLGEYRLDGFELDGESAHRVLAGRIMEPHGPSLGDRVSIAAGKPAEGLPLRFVAPVEKLGGPRELAEGSDVIFNWKPYPNAVTYAVQVREAASSHDFPRTQLFEWDERPRVLEPSVNLSREGARFKPGHYYFVEVTAEDASGMAIATTADAYRQFDFMIGGRQDR